MLIAEPNGLYTINYDSGRKVVFQSPAGLWTKENYHEYHMQFVNKIGPALGKKPWALCTDFRKYKLSDLGDEIKIHTEWMYENNLQCSAVIVDSAIVKMQMNRVMDGKVPQQAFLSEAEAEEWLKSKGF